MSKNENNEKYGMSEKNERVSEIIRNESVFNNVDSNDNYKQQIFNN